MKEEADSTENKIVELYEELLKKTVDEMKRYFDKNLVSVVLYGSLARGDVKKDSDIDLLVIFEDLPKERLKLTFSWEYWKKCKWHSKH
jgi:predicted nucleotidyltransferase